MKFKASTSLKFTAFDFVLTRNESESNIKNTIAAINITESYTEETDHEITKKSKSNLVSEFKDVPLVFTNSYIFFVVIETKHWVLFFWLSMAF